MSQVLTTQLSTSSEYLKEENSVYKTYNRFFRSISREDDEDASNDSTCDSRRASIFSYISNSFSFSDEVSFNCLQLSSVMKLFSVNKL